MKLAFMTGPEEENGVFREYGLDGADGEVEDLDARGKKYGESDVEDDGVSACKLTRFWVWFCEFRPSPPDGGVCGAM